MSVIDSVAVTPLPGEELPAVVNNEDVELGWASRAGEHADKFFDELSQSTDTSKFKFTDDDDLIYSWFRNEFPLLRVDVIDENEIKSPQSKEQWRPFMMRFENVIEDFNMGTLLRIDAKKPYTPENTLLVPRIQFYCIELARCRELCNIKDDVGYRSGPQTYAGFSSRGIAAYRQQHFEDAEFCFSRAKALASVTDRSHPNFSLLLANLSATLCQLRDFAAALVIAEEAIAASPSHERGYRRKAEALLSQNRFEESALAFDKCLKWIDKAKEIDLFLQRQNQLFQVLEKLKNVNPDHHLLEDHKI